MYQKYSTDAIVLRGYERGEADRVFALYTREFGSLWARASAVRRESSKMRYALQQYSLVRASLVRGTTGWRLAGAAATRTLDPANPGARTFARVTALVERLVAGEERNDYLFATLAEAHLAFMDTTREAHATIELLCVARALFALGYVSAEAAGAALFAHSAYGLSDLQAAEATRAQLLTSVNRALSETQL